ncbi:MAG: hypothetical protein ACRDHG_13570 [Anaerolineales bacterium]
MKLNKRWMIVLIVSSLLISALVAAFALTGSRTPVAAAASAQTTGACVDDDVAGEFESEADDANEAEDADCPGDVED